MQPDLGGIYAEVLAAALMALTYGCGIPLMYPVVCVACVFCYWTEKYSFLRLYRKPMECGKDMARLAARALRVRVGVGERLGIHMSAR